MTVTGAAEELARFADEHAAEALALLDRIVNLDSCSPNPAGVDEVASLLGAGLESAGFATDRVPPPKSSEDAWLADFFLPEIGSFDLVADHLVGRKAGSGAGHALLIGHMDTAFPPGEPAFNPFRVDGERAYGCAIADMKAGLVVILYAVKALAATGLAVPRITVLYDSDEQAGSLTARQLIERIVRDDGVTWAFKAELGLDGGKLRNRRPALGVALVEVDGIQRHVGTGFWEGASAVVSLAKKTVQLQQLSDRERFHIVNVGEFHGGQRRNLVAGRAFAKLDIRARTQAEWDDLAARVREIAEEETLPGTNGRAKIYNHRPAMEPTERTEALMRTVEGAAESLGQAVDYVDAAAGSDANFTAAMGIPTLDGFGPHGANTMTRDEYIEIPTLAARVALLALTLNRLASGDEIDS
jgi:glutamate carboxypeptidase